MCLGALFIWSVCRKVQRLFGQCLPKQGISDRFCHAVSPRADRRTVLNVQPHTAFIILCQTQSTAAENTELLHVGCPSSHLQHAFIYASNIRNTNASIFQVMQYLEKALELSSERSPHSEILYPQTGFLLFK